MEKPKVFAPGDMTICIGPSGFRVYAGVQELDAVIDFEMRSGGFLELVFPIGVDRDDALRIEEQIRQASTSPNVRCRLQAALISSDA